MEFTGAYIAPSSIMKAGEQGKCLQIISSLISLYHATKVCGDLSRKVSSSNSSGQPRQKTGACIVKGTTRTPVTNLEGVAPHIALGFLINYSFKGKQFLAI